MVMPPGAASPKLGILPWFSSPAAGRNFRADKRCRARRRATSRLQESKLVLARHEQGAIVGRYFILQDLPGEIPLTDMTLAAGGGNSVALLELEHRCGAGIVERLILVAPFSSGAPVDVKRSDAMNLDDGAIRDIAEHRAPLGNERVPASPYLLHRCTVEFLAHCEIEGSLHHSDVLIHRMFVGRNNRARKLADSHHERLAGNIRIAVDHLEVLRQRLQWDDTVLTRFRRVTHRGGCSEKHDDADRCQPGNS